MKLSYFYVAADVPDGIIPESSVVIDVLRATTTIAWALENGADSVQVFADVDELKNQAKTSLMTAPSLNSGVSSRPR